MTKRKSKRNPPIDKTFQEIILPVLSPGQMSVLAGTIPKHAIKTRPGRGDKTFTYAPYGWYVDQLNKAFGFDWDYKLLPVFNGSIYALNVEQYERVKKGKKETVTIRNISIYGELTIRVRHPKDFTSVIATITKPGPGSQNWEKTIEFGDALKGAKSDGLKVAAHEFGIGLELYWNDSAELQAYDERQERLNAPPKTIAELWPRLKAINKSKSSLEAAQLLGCDVKELKDRFNADPAGAWEVLSQ